MYPFLETIRLQKGYMTPWEDHQQRVDRTFQHFGAKPSLQVRTVLSGLDLPDGQIYKVSVWYSLEGDTHIKWQPYQVRSIRTIKLMPLPEVDYSFKFADRGWINELVTQAGTDDILLHDQGFIRDASYANVALFDGKEWFTPLQPLLAGTHRERLLRQGRICTENIHIEDLGRFQEMRWINALMEWDEASRINKEGLQQLIR
jgi:4-amino-4-deoxychorismate lyase